MLYFDQSDKVAISKLLGSDANFVMTYETGSLIDYATLFVGKCAQAIHDPGVVNGTPPLQIRFSLSQLADLREFIDSIIELQQSNPTSE